MSNRRQTGILSVLLPYSRTVLCSTLFRCVPGLLCMALVVLCALCACFFSAFHFFHASCLDSAVRSTASIVSNASGGNRRHGSRPSGPAPPLLCCCSRSCRGCLETGNSTVSCILVSRGRTGMEPMRGTAGQHTLHTRQSRCGRVVRTHETLSLARESR